MIDENEFFRNASLRICGNLEIEAALHATFVFIRDFVPADEVFLQYFDPGFGTMRTIAKADKTGGHRLDLVTPLREPDLDDRYLRDTYSVGNAVAKSGIAANWFETTMLRFYGYEETSASLMAMKLFSDAVFHGGIIFVADGLDRFSDDHARLVSLLSDPLAIAMKNSIEHQEVLHLRDKLADDNRFLNKRLLHLSGDEIIGADLGLRSVMKQVQQVAPTESLVLLTGETGVGKEVIANAIHLGSPKRDGPFVPVNCGAIPDSMLDSELFGHEKGAFTGALSRKRGRFERADKGTILLDEIGDMPLDAQVRLLRVIQHREIERLGGTERIPVDIRIIASTNQDLETMVQAGRFRRDLWFRLNVFPIFVPPLRDRRTDIPTLVQYFMERKARDMKFRGNPCLASGAIDVLNAHDWPGNVRELENVVERAMILHRGEPLRFNDLGASFSGRAAAEPPETDNETLDLDTVVVRHITRVLDITGGKIHGPGGAGELLGVNPNTLRYRMQKLGIPYLKQK